MLDRCSAGRMARGLRPCQGRGASRMTIGVPSALRRGAPSATRSSRAYPRRPESALGRVAVKRAGRVETGGMAASAGWETRTVTATVARRGRRVPSGSGWCGNGRSRPGVLGLIAADLLAHFGDQLRDLVCGACADEVAPDRVHEFFGSTGDASEPTDHRRSSSWRQHRLRVAVRHSQRMGPVFDKSAARLRPGYGSVHREQTARRERAPRGGLRRTRCRRPAREAGAPC